MAANRTRDARWCDAHMRSDPAAVAKAMAQSLAAYSSKKRAEAATEDEVAEY